MDKNNTMDLRQLSDTALIHMIRNDQIEVFNELLGRYRACLFSYILSLSADPDLSDDILQDVFIKAYRKISQFRFQSSFKSWLFAIARNTWKNYLRARKDWHYIDAYQDVYSVDIANNMSVEDEIIDIEQRQNLYRAIQLLPKQQMRTMMLRVDRELSFREVSCELQCSESTAKANFYYGSRSLEKILAA